MQTKGLRAHIEVQSQIGKKSHPMAHTQQFKKWSPRTQGTNLSVNGSRLPSVLSLRADHFSVLGASRCASDPKLDTYVSSVAELDTKSFSAQDSVLNCPIVQEEVNQAINQAINHLKTKSAGGADSLYPYHLKHSSPLFRTWLCHVFNTIVSLEEIPSSFKFGLNLQRKGERSADSWKL